ncbi:MAG: helix-turn-helix transcriptional regulator [Slackia sp.]
MRHSMAFGGKDAPRIVRVVCALSLLLLSSSAMNATVFPLFDGVFTYARDMSVLANAGVLALVGLVAAFAPSRLHARASTVASFAIFAAAGVALPCALALESAWMLSASSCLLAVARGWATLCVGLAASRLRPKEAVVAVTAAFAVYCCADVLLWLLPDGFGMAAFLLSAPLALALCRNDARPVLDVASAAAPPADVAVTQPSSFLPLAGSFFVCLFLFRVAFGYSLRFFEQASGPLPGFVGAVPVVAAAVVVMAALRGRFLADLAMQASVLIVVAGFFTAATLGEASAQATAGLLSAGNTLFDLVAWVVLVSVAARNERGAVAVISWGRGVSGIGTIVGAALGVWSTRAFGQDSHLAVFVAGALILVFVGYALIGLKNFSFAEVIEGVVPTVDQPEAKTPEEEFEERCSAIAQRHGLSPRECEVFVMLARGRNREYIQEQLVVSRNTVKAHVKHVYAKLGIHAHQELIDLVEAGL